LYVGTTTSAQSERRIVIGRPRWWAEAPRHGRVAVQRR
jgi:hypothetical protein